MAVEQIHDHAKPIGPKLESGRMARPKSAQAGSPDAAPAPKAGAKGSPGKAGPGLAATTALRVGKGVTHAGQGAASNNGGITAMMAAVFGIVALAKVRGQASISTSHALFGGFILMFLLTLMYKLNQKLATMFALLVLIAALMEYGEAAFSGLFGAGSGVPAATTPNIFANGGSPNATPAAPTQYTVGTNANGGQVNVYPPGSWTVSPS